MTAHPNSQMGQLQIKLRTLNADITNLNKRHRELSALIAPPVEGPAHGLTRRQRPTVPGGAVEPVRGVLRLDPFASDKDAAKYTLGQATYKSLLEATEYELARLTPERDRTQKELKALYAKVMGLQEIVDEPITAPQVAGERAALRSGVEALLSEPPVESRARQVLRRKSAALGILEILGDPKRAASARASVEALIAKEADTVRDEYLGNLAPESVQDDQDVRRARLATQQDPRGDALSVALSKGTESGRPPTKR